MDDEFKKGLFVLRQLLHCVLAWFFSKVSLIRKRAWVEFLYVFAFSIYKYWDIVSLDEFNNRKFYYYCYVKYGEWLLINNRIPRKKAEKSNVKIKHDPLAFIQFHLHHIRLLVDFGKPFFLFFFVTFLLPYCHQHYSFQNVLPINYSFIHPNYSSTRERVQKLY
mgnify:CR=1 FL=1